ncbi:MAG TPA: Crp/Fnr family transcriptional regulator [Candidatus Acidoferrales bacterium]|nr:Crp/Fnr family transcriptional regulator [Candidatus Acidoferrales bacterium]
MKAAVAVPARPEAKSRLFERLSPVQAQEILSAGRLRRVFAKQVVTYPGDPATHFYLLCSGRARYFVSSAEGQKVVFQWLIRPGDQFAYATLLPSGRALLAGVEILQSGSVVAWERERIRGLFAKYPQLWDNAMSENFELFVRVVAHDMSLTGLSAAHRLRQALVDLSYGIGRPVARGMEVDVTNEDLARMAGVTMFTASRCLSEWVRLGVIDKKRGSIVLRSADRLFTVRTKTP